MNHGTEMRRIAFESALSMAKIMKECDGDIDEMIQYLETKVEEEAKQCF